jgi:endonuclease/exonuclease/phosphatase family metal-dependent hydrolase
LKRFIRRTLFYLNIIAGTALLLSYLSTYISPAKIWVLAFFGLAYPYILVINLLFMLIWIIWFKKEFLLSFLLILIGINHFDNFLPLRLGKTNTKRYIKENPEPFKILSYNVRLFNIYEWISDPGTNQEILNFINSERPEIICLQEFYTSTKNDYQPEKIKKFFSETPYNYIHYSFKNGINSGYGIATFSRYPIINQGIISFPKTTNEAIFTDIVIKNDTIRIYNNHLQSIQLQRRNYSFLDTIKLRYDDEQLKEIMDISSRLKTAYIKRSAQVEAISAHIKMSPFPVIVCGDFNDTPVSYSYRKMRKGLKDAFISAGQGTGSTYQGIFPYFRIDYIFHDKHFKPLLFEKVEAKLSDHYPIICVFEILDHKDSNSKP